MQCGCSASLQALEVRALWRRVAGLAAAAVVVAAPAAGVAAATAAAAAALG